MAKKEVEALLGAPRRVGDADENEAAPEARERREEGASGSPDLPLRPRGRRG